MTSKPNEAAIDEIIACCSGDMLGALKALLLVNEHLEALTGPSGVAATPCTS